MRARFLEFVLENPQCSQGDAAKALGVTRQRISQLCKREGVTLQRPPPRPLPDHGRTTEITGTTLMGRARPRFIGTADNSSTGALAEVIACADLMDRGHHVFRSLGPSSPCDLIVLIGNRPFRVEVKTSRRGRGGAVVKPNRVPDRFDVLACVLPGPEVHYFANADGWPIEAT
jgi:hypothetical protein